MARAGSQFKRARAARAWAALALALAGLACGAAGARAQAPDEDWRTLSTEHFRVTFPAGLDALAARAGAYAEAAYAELSARFVEPPEGTIDILLTDHTDESNGYAQVLPSNRVTVLARPPVDGLSVSHFDDWLQLVVTHELVHVFHLDATRTLPGRLARAVFGRADDEWPFFPNLATPAWAIEGAATWYESVLTDAGRVRGTFTEMVLRTAVLEGRFEGIDQASGASPLWPAGSRPYAYGALLLDHLLHEHGAAALAAFAEAVAGQWVPYRLDAAGREAFGVSLSDAWARWADELRERYAGLDHELARLGPVSEPERLTRGARWGLHPTVSPDGGTLVHVQADGRSDTQLRWRSLGADEEGSLRTNGLATYAWLSDGRLLVSQLEHEGPYRTYADLWIIDPRSGDARRVTEGARLEQPSVAPGGRSAVAVREGGGTNGLVRLDLATGEITPLVRPDPDVHWAFPRFSPDGRWIAATRWERGARHDVVVLDAATGRTVHRVTDDRALDLAPAWSPDGRWIVWGSDRTGIMNVLGARVDPATGETGSPVLLTNVRTGAAYPAVDPAGRWLYFSGYHVDGWEVERVPFVPDVAPPAPPAAARFARSRPLAAAAPPPADEAEPYSPLPTLRPYYWKLRYRDPVVVAAHRDDTFAFPRLEVLGFGIGAETTGTDLVGRHAYGVYAQVFTSGGEWEAGAAYSFRGLGNPVLSLSAEQTWSPAGHYYVGPSADTAFAIARTRRLGASVLTRATRWRSELALSVAGALLWQDLDLRTSTLGPSPLSAPGARIAETRVGLTYGTARSHSFQLGAARGLELAAELRTWRHLGLAEADRGREGIDRSFDEVTARARGYVPLWSGGRARHVLAVRLAGGWARGPGSSRGHFAVGGAAGEDEGITGFELFGGDPLFLPVRGYDVGTRAGRLAWSGSAEYRFPIALLNRGLGAWPLHFDRLWGTLFADAGNAWEPAPAGRPLASAGAEATLSILGLWNAGLMLRAGVAVPLTGGADPGVYVRAGLSF